MKKADIRHVKVRKMMGFSAIEVLRMIRNDGFCKNVGDDAILAAWETV